MKTTILTLKGEYGGVQVIAKRQAELSGSRLVQGHFYRFWELRESDVVLVHYSTYHLAPALLARWFFGVPFVMAFHGGDVRLSDVPPWSRNLWRWFQMFTARRASRIVFCSLRLMKDAGDFDEYKDKMVVIYNPVEEYPQSTEDDDSIIWVGSRKREKDIDTAISVFEILASRHQRLRVKMMIGVPHETLLKELASSSVLLSTSTAEGLPMTILEAMKMGKTGRRPL